MICSLDFYRSEQSLSNDMMKYRLKDKYTQRRLDEISNGDFTERLQESVSDVAPCVVVSFGKYPGEEKRLRFMAAFEHKEVEAIPALYDPTVWNEWPNAEPPRNKLLRTEILTERIDWDTPEPRGGKSRFKGSGIFDGTEWYFYDATTRKEGETVRFRPWVGPDEEDSK